jgi:hypothetical protein
VIRSQSRCTNKSSGHLSQVLITLPTTISTAGASRDPLPLQNRRYNASFWTLSRVSEMRLHDPGVLNRQSERLKADIITLLQVSAQCLNHSMNSKGASAQIPISWPICSFSRFRGVQNLKPHRPVPDDLTVSSAMNVLTLRLHNWCYSSVELRPVAQQ